jgi:hypothetical protein
VRATVSKLELRASAAFDHKHDLFVQMALGMRGAPARNIDCEEVAKVAATLEVDSRAIDAVTWPGPGLDRYEIAGQAFVRYEPFIFDPVAIGIETQASAFRGIHRDKAFRRAKRVSLGGSN